MRCLTLFQHRSKIVNACSLHMDSWYSSCNYAMTWWYCLLLLLLLRQGIEMTSCGIIYCAQRWKVYAITEKLLKVHSSFEMQISIFYLWHIPEYESVKLTLRLDDTWSWFNALNAIVLRGVFVWVHFTLVHRKKLFRFEHMEL